jgi:hypothetical protein
MMNKQLLSKLSLKYGILRLDGFVIQTLYGQVPIYFYKQ